MSCPTCDEMKHHGAPGVDRICAICRRPFTTSSERTRARLRRARELDAPIFTLTRRMLEEWSGRKRWTEDQIERIAAALPFSSLPDTVATVAGAILDDERAAKRGEPADAGTRAHLAEHDRRLAEGDA